TITAAGMDAADRLTAKQRDALALLAGAPSGVPTPELAARGISADTISRLVGHGLVALRQDRVDRDPFDTAVIAAVEESGHGLAGRERQLTVEQAAALARLRTMSDRAQFGVALLHGVTGSGKTEIYLRITEHVR